VQPAVTPPGITGKESFRAFQLLPFIFAINAVGGLMYALVENLSSPPSGTIGYYSLVPYIVFLFLAGFLADRLGRRINAILGAIAVGVGFMCLGIFTGELQFFFVQTFLVGGYAFIDVFIWVIGADLARGRNVTLVYTILFATNILAILTGVLLAEQIGEAASGSEVLGVSMAGLFSLVSLLFIIRFRENYHYRLQLKSRAQAFEDMVTAIKLTPRETSVAKLLLDGADTREILKELVIAPDTLKSHLRNIYRKAGVKNRLEFTMAVLNNVSGPDVGTEES
jgi:DNA-binding CsgD family transcriptional regulator